MRTLWREVGEHPLIWAGLAGGCGIGAIIRLPLLPPLQESAANVIGAAVGAILAVAGATYVANMQASKTRKATTRLIVLTLEELRRGIQLVLELAEQTDRVAHAERERAVPLDEMGRARILGAIAGTFSAVRGLALTAQRTASRLAIFVGNPSAIDPHLAIAAVDAQECVKNFSSMLMDLRDNAPDEPSYGHVTTILGTGECKLYFADQLDDFRQELDLVFRYFPARL